MTTAQALDFASVFVDGCMRDLLRHVDPEVLLRLEVAVQNCERLAGAAGKILTALDAVRLLASRKKSKGEFSEPAQDIESWFLPL